MQPKESADFDYAHSPFARHDAAATGGDGDGDEGEEGDGDSVVGDGDGDGDGRKPVATRDAGSSTQPEEDAGSSSGPKPTSLSFDVLTVALGGRYQPRNIGAIWVANSSGAWVKTLAVWASTRERYLTKFRAASGGNRVDAVTSATLWFHQTHSVKWDLKDVSHKDVPDGEYQVWVETTDRDGFGDATSVTFTKGTKAVNLSPPDQPHYVDMHLVYQ